MNTALTISNIVFLIFSIFMIGLNIFLYLLGYADGAWILVSCVCFIIVIIIQLLMLHSRGII